MTSPQNSPSDPANHRGTRLDSALDDYLLAKSKANQTGNYRRNAERVLTEFLGWAEERGVEIFEVLDVATLEAYAFSLNRRTTGDDGIAATTARKYYDYVVNAAGLLLTAKIVSFAGQFGLGGAVATVSATVLALVGGFSRIVVGGVSDRISRKWAVVVSAVLSGVGLFALVWFADARSGVGVILAVIIATFFWSPQFALFPSLVGDYYGQRNSSSNYALVYLGKVGGGIFSGAVAGWLITATSWSTTFLIAGVLAGVGTMVLRPPSLGCSSPD